MNSLERQAEIKELIHLIQEKQLEIEQARKNDVVFEDMKKLYLELKTLNSNLGKVLDQVKFKAPDDLPY